MTSSYSASVIETSIRSRTKPALFDQHVQAPERVDSGLDQPRRTLEARRRRRCFGTARPRRPGSPRPPPPPWASGGLRDGRGGPARLPLRARRGPGARGRGGRVAVGMVASPARPPALVDAAEGTSSACREPSRATPKSVDDDERARPGEREGVRRPMPRPPPVTITTWPAQRPAERPPAAPPGAGRSPEGVPPRGCRLRGCRLRGCRPRGCRLRGCRPRGCRPGGAA